MISLGIKLNPFYQWFSWILVWYFARTRKLTPPNPQNQFWLLIKSLVVGSVLWAGQSGKLVAKGAFNHHLIWYWVLRSAPQKNTWRTPGWVWCWSFSTLWASTFYWRIRAVRLYFCTRCSNGPSKPFKKLVVQTLYWKRLIICVFHVPIMVQGLDICTLK